MAENFKNITILVIIGIMGAILTPKTLIETSFSPGWEIIVRSTFGLLPIIPAGIILKIRQIGLVCKQ